MSKVVVLNHALVKHKLTNIRKKDTSTKDFYQNVNEIAGLMAYEITREFPLKAVEIETPICKSVQYELANDVVIVPILRAGLGMVDGIRDLIPRSQTPIISTFLHDSGSHPSVLGDFLGFISFISIKPKFSEKYGCKFHDGVLVTVTPWKYIFLQ